VQIGISHYLVISSVLFTLGVLTVLNRRNIIVILMGIELMLNSAGLNFAAFSRFVVGNSEGQAFSIFIILVAAAEAAVALAIVLRTFQNLKTVEIDKIQSLKN